MDVSGVHWIWKGSMTRVGSIVYDGEQAQRLAFRIMVGKIQRGWRVSWLCGERGCVRDTHLFQAPTWVLISLRHAFRRGDRAEVERLVDVLVQWNPHLGDGLDVEAVALPAVKYDTEKPKAWRGERSGVKCLKHMPGNDVRPKQSRQRWVRKTFCSGNVRPEGVQIDCARPVNRVAPGQDGDFDAATELERFTRAQQERRE